MNTLSVIKCLSGKKINHACMSKDTSCFATYKMGRVNQINIKNQT